MLKRPQSPVSEVVFQQTVTVIPPDALHTIPTAPLSAQLTAKVSSSQTTCTCTFNICLSSIMRVKYQVLLLIVHLVITVI